MVFVLKNLLKRYLENLKYVGYKLRRIGGGMRGFRQNLDERERERSLTRCAIETMSLTKIVKR